MASFDFAILADRIEKSGVSILDSAYVEEFKRKMEALDKRSDFIRNFFYWASIIGDIVLSPLIIIIGFLFLAALAGNNELAIWGFGLSIVLLVLGVIHSHSNSVNEYHGSWKTEHLSDYKMGKLPVAAGSDVKDIVYKCENEIFYLHVFKYRDEIRGVMLSVCSGYIQYDEDGDIKNYPEEVFVYAAMA